MGFYNFIEEIYEGWVMIGQRCVQKLGAISISVHPMGVQKVKGRQKCSEAKLLEPQVKPTKVGTYLDL